MANRGALRMANLTAAQMLKAEVDGKTLPPAIADGDKTAAKSNLSAAERLKLEMAGEDEVKVEESSINLESVDVKVESDVKMELDPTSDGIDAARGIKRKATTPIPKEEEEEVVQDEDEETDDGPSGSATPLIVGQHAGLPQLVLLGNNVAEQEDIVK